MSVHPLILLLTIVSIHLLAVISPGPAFLLVTRTALARSRAAGIATGWGVAAAATLWALAASVGIGVVLARYPMLGRMIQLAGGAYLVWIGVEAWRHAGEPLAGNNGRLDRRSGGLWRACWFGFTANLTNPKMIVFFGSIFVTLFTTDTPAWVRVAALAMVPINEGCWFTLVSCLFATRRIRAAYDAAKSTVDRVVGTVMGGFGVRLLAGAMRQIGQ